MRVPPSQPPGSHLFVEAPGRLGSLGVGWVGLLGWVGLGLWDFWDFWDLGGLWFSLVDFAFDWDVLQDLFQGFLSDLPLMFEVCLSFLDLAFHLIVWFGLVSFCWGFYSVFLSDLFFLRFGCGFGRFGSPFFRFDLIVYFWGVFLRGVNLLFLRIFTWFAFLEVWFD